MSRVAEKLRYLESIIRKQAKELYDQSRKLDEQAQKIEEQAQKIEELDERIEIKECRKGSI